MLLLALWYRRRQQRKQKQPFSSVSEGSSNWGSETVTVSSPLSHFSSPVQAHGVRVFVSPQRLPLSNAPVSQSATVALPPGWSRHGPDEDGDFWFQDRLGESHWTIPEEMRWASSHQQSAGPVFASREPVLSQANLLAAMSTGRQTAGLSRFQDDEPGRQSAALSRFQDDEPPLVGGWFKCEDAENEWFTNSTTGEVSWTLPVGARLLSGTSRAI